MTDADSLRELLAFFRIEQTDLDVLARLGPQVEKHADSLVASFYSHLERFPETRKLIQNDEVRDRLAVAQRSYLLSLTEPTIDRAYFELRSQIGRTHERIGLDTQWYLGAYAIYFSLLVPLIREALGHDPRAMEAAVVALKKRLDFDAEIAIRQYIDRREHQLQILNEKLRAEGRSLKR